jgi:hypothetical protein
MAQEYAVDLELLLTVTVWLPATTKGEAHRLAAQLPLDAIAAYSAWPRLDSTTLQTRRVVGTPTLTAEEVL